jgi:hypothetical protein
MLPKTNYNLLSDDYGHVCAGLSYMVFVVGCLVAIVVISIIGFLWDHGNKSALPGARARSLPSAPVTPLASQKTAAPLEVKVKTKTPQRQIGEWTGEYNYADLSTLSGVNANYGGYEGPLLERVLDVPHAGYSKILCYAAEGKPRELDAQDARHWIIAINRGGSPLSSSDGGPYLLLKRQDVTKSLHHLARIEAV